MQSPFAACIAGRAEGHFGLFLIPTWPCMIDIAVQYSDLIRAMTHTSKVDNNLVVVVPMAMLKHLLIFLLYWTPNLTKGEIEH